MRIYGIPPDGRYTTSYVATMETDSNRLPANRRTEDFSPARTYSSERTKKRENARNGKQRKEKPRLRKLAHGKHSFLAFDCRDTTIDKRKQERR